MQPKKPGKLCDKQIKNKKFNEIMIKKIKEELDSKIESYTNKEISACIKNPGTCKHIIYTRNLMRL